MKKVIIVGIIATILFLVGSYFLIAGGNKPIKQIISYNVNDTERPKVEIKKTFSDLGKMKVNEEKIGVFTIKNIGQKPLQLSDVSSSCSCALAQIVINGKESELFAMHKQSDYVGEIAQGKKVQVKVIYRPYIMPVYGVVEREAYVSTNDPLNPKLVFKVKAFVQ